ncbi:MAG TPA: hypothetical protein VOB72_27515 [Candidatus Dormibacteraeota bacterium]|nr:hypothetical protein [Candidatus Dormibacteraeota bacterium]
MPDLDLRNVRAIVTDAEVLGRLEPDAVADYLARNGWIRSGGRKTGSVWSRELDSTRAAAVFLPDDQTYADYAVRMGELLTMLARVEDRSQLAILADLIGASAHDASPATTGTELIAAERRRQIEAEGRTPEHDDQHDGGELIEAARCYVYAALVAEHADLAEWFGLDAEGRFKLPHPANARWPWSPAQWKPTGDPVRDLTKAGALIAAEVDRLLRKAAREGRP